MLLLQTHHLDLVSEYFFFSFTVVVIAEMLTAAGSVILVDLLFVSFLFCHYTRQEES